jgi:hypothetical protein
MAEARCLHLKRVSGVLQVDLRRTVERASLYSVQLVADICETCGKVELYCDSHREACSWLMSSLPTGNKQ